MAVADPRRKAAALIAKLMQPKLPIPQIQGRGSLSPYVGDRVQTEGVITGIQKMRKNPGVFVQDRVGDKDPATSDGIFAATNKVFDTGKDQLQVGQLVSVAGRVGEQNNLTTIETLDKGLTILERKPLDQSELPAPAPLSLPKKQNAAVPYLEAREGMLVTLPNAMAIAPTNKWDQWVAVDEKAHGPQRDRDDKRAGQRIIVSGALKVPGGKPQLTTGDRPAQVSGPLTYDWDTFQILQSQPLRDVQRGAYPPKKWGDLDNDDVIGATDLKGIKARIGKPAEGPLDPADLNGDGKITRTDAKQAQERAARVTGAPTFRVASLNAENMFDMVDEPAPIDDERVSKNMYEAKLARVAGSIREHLDSPELIAMQEVENQTVLRDLVQRPELRAMGYKYELLPGVDRRGINVGLLYRGDSVQVSNVRQAQKQLEMQDEMVPQGGKPTLFTRPPLVADVTVRNGEQTTDLTMLVNHFKSKFSPNGTPTEPRRLEQAKFVGGLVDELRAKNPEREVMVVGDLNDHERSKTIKSLVGPSSNPRLVNTGVEFVPKGERFSYNYKGLSELIDHILVTPGLARQVEQAGVRHFNADIPASARWNTAPYGSSDHDSPYAVFRFGEAPAASAAAGAAAVQPGAERANAA